jgi:hypothetical protein
VKLGGVIDICFLDDIGQCWIFTTHFSCRVLVVILKMADFLKILKTQNCSSNGDLSLCQIWYHHNTAQIQHCPISTTFHMWVDYDVPNWFLTLKNFYRLPFSKWLPLNLCGIVAPFWKWRPTEIFRSQESIRDIIIYPHMKCRWNRTMLNLCGIFG